MKRNKKQTTAEVPKHRKTGKNKKPRNICKITGEPHDYNLSVHVMEYGYNVWVGPSGYLHIVGFAHNIIHTDRCKNCKAKRVRRVVGDKDTYSKQRI